MADEPAQAPDEVQDKPDTPEAEAPEQDKPAPEESVEHWRNQYEQIQPEFTRKSQQLSQYEQLIQAAQQGDPEALEALGLELADGDEEEEGEGEDEFFRDPRVDVLLEQQMQAEAQAEAEQQREQLEEYLDDQFDALEQETGKTFSDKGDNAEEFKAILALALRNPTDDGMPDVKGAHKALEGLFESRFEAWKESKKAPQAPFGKAAAHVPDLDTPEARAEYINRMAQDLE